MDPSSPNHLDTASFTSGEMMEEFTKLCKQLMGLKPSGSQMDLYLRKCDP